MMSPTNSSSQNPVDAPSVVTMVRERGHLLQADAEAYAQSLQPESQKLYTGCYVYRCARFWNCPMGCAYHLSCGNRVWPGISTVPFLCFMCMFFQPQKGYYLNIKGDTLIAKVDEEKDTLACYEVGCGGPCCYCERTC